MHLFGQATHSRNTNQVFRILSGTRRLFSCSLTHPVFPIMRSSFISKKGEPMNSSAPQNEKLGPVRSILFLKALRLVSWCKPETLGFSYPVMDWRRSSEKCWEKLTSLDRMNVIPWGGNCLGKTVEKPSKGLSNIQLCASVQRIDVCLSSCCQWLRSKLARTSRHLSRLMV